MPINIQRCIIIVSALVCSTLAYASFPTQTLPLHYRNKVAFLNSYYLPINVGKPAATIWVLADTGSAPFVVNGCKPLCQSCRTLYLNKGCFTYNKNSKLVNVGMYANLNYEIGNSTVQQADTTVSIGNLDPMPYRIWFHNYTNGPGQVIGLIRKQYPNYLTPYVPYITYLHKIYGMPLVFSMRLCDVRGESTLTLGDYDRSVTLKQIQYSKMISPYNYKIHVINLMAGPNSKRISHLNQNMVLDSGTNPVVLPKKSFMKLTGYIKKYTESKGLHLPAGFWGKCDKTHTFLTPGNSSVLSEKQIQSFPNIMVSISNADPSKKPFLLTINPNTYLIKQSDGRRLLGLKCANQNVFVLGNILMSNYITVFDMRKGLGHGVIGFYPSKNICIRSK